MPVITRQLQKASVVDVHLTKLAQGFSAGKLVAEQIMPKVTVPTVTGRYIVWNSDAFRIENLARGLGARAHRSDYSYDVESYTMPDGYASEFFVDDREDQQTAGVANLNLPKQKLALEQRKMATQKEKEIADLVTNVANHNNHGAVSNAASANGAGQLGWDRPDTPIYDDIEAAKEDVADKIGQYPNVLILSRKVWRALRRNTQLQSFFKNTDRGAAAFTTKMIADILELDEIIIPTAIYTTSSGQRADIWGTATAVLLYRGEPQGDTAVDPSSLPPSFGWLLQLQGQPKVVKYRDEPSQSTVAMVMDCYKGLQTSKDASYHFDTVLG